MARACKECGSEPVDHRLTYILVGMDETMRPLSDPGPVMRFLMRRILAFERAYTPLLFALFIRLGLAKEIATPDERTLLLAKMIWEEANHRGVTMKEVRLFNLPRNMFRAHLPTGKTVIFEGMPLPPEANEQATWMDNKAETKKRFLKAGIPVARGGSAVTFSGALRIYQSITAPVIVKPYSGSGSRHTTLHIQDEDALRKGFESAKQVAPLALIEEELVGPVFRATVVGGKTVGVLRRDPPHVIGDGVHTVEELVQDANTHPARGGPYFSPIALTPDAEAELAWQGQNRTSVPEKGKRITLHQKVNWSLGGTTADVTDETHDDNRLLFERVAEELKTPLVGIDFIIEDVTRSWKEQERAGVIECNSMPFFDNHHLPFEGNPRNVAGAIWDLYLYH